MKFNPILRLLFAVIITVAIGWSNEAHAQLSKNNFTKWNRSYYKSKYSASIKRPSKTCSTINKKRNKKDKKPLFAYKPAKYKSKPQAEAGGPVASTPPPRPVPKIVPKPAPKPAPIVSKSFEEMSLSEKREASNEILKKNLMPLPTSEEHNKIRQEVEKQMETIEDDKPIKLEPLYFTFDQDEFAFVDMEPFLVAVEYALQGRIILIEGHTDARGNDTYNVQLSIKRVEKIRSLMIDMGVPDERISIVGYGEEKVDGEDDQNNRRVDFTVF